MANNPSSYTIIDEPKARFWEHLIVNPLLILFVAILAPLFWTLPLMAKVWFPILWLGFNGYLLGSTTLAREIGLLLGGLTLYVVTFIGGVYLTNTGAVFEDPTVAYPYIRIILQAILYATLLLVIFKQSTSYALYQYIKQQANR